MTGIATGNLWVTRLRAALPVGALSQDLVLEATASQNPVSNAHHTNSYTIANYDPCAGPSQKNGAAPAASSSGCSCRTVESNDRYADVLMLSLGTAGLLLSLRRRTARARR
jgi:hypothetical protein